MVDGLLKPPLQQVLVALEAECEQPSPAGMDAFHRAVVNRLRHLRRQMEPVNGVEEEQRAHPLVKVLAAPAETRPARRIRCSIAPADSPAQAASSDWLRSSGSVAVMI